MKRKKTLSGFILALSLTLVSNSLTSVASSSAEVVTWDYTYEINMNIEFDNEGAHCYVEIVGFPCVSEIDNITVTLVEMVGKQKNLLKNGVAYLHQVISLNYGETLLMFQAAIHTVSPQQLMFIVME